MCGLIGVLDASRDGRARAELGQAMLAPLAHRGPDAWGVFSDGIATLGHVRLSIVDLADGHQPMVNERYALAFNGEVFNHIELRAELEALGRTFKTHSDTEVVLEAIDEWGPEAFRRFNGQFAILCWDRRERRLLLARDRFGIRPLYVLTHGGAHYFASEYRSFDQIPGFRRAFEPASVLEHGLFWNTLGDRTVYAGIRCVSAGTYEWITPGEMAPRVERYYELGEAPPHDLPRSFEEAKEALRERLSRAVALRLRADVPVGNYLSGGIDSSVITILTDRLRSDRFQTFSIAFKDAAYDESGYQQEMVSRLDCDPFTLRIGYDDIEDRFEDAVRHAERPLFRTAPVPLYLLAKHVREHGIRVVLTGEAADEMLWGYDSYKELKLLQFWGRQPKSSMRPQLLRSLYPHLAHYRDGKQFGLMRMFYEGFLGTYDNVLAGLNIRVHNNRILANYLRKEHREDASDEVLAERVAGHIPKNYWDWSLLQRNQFLEMRTLLPGYLLSSQGDRMSLSSGIEGRYPFLDHELVDWAFHLPVEYKMPRLSQKHLLRETFRQDLPASVVDRPKQPYQAPDLRAFYHRGGLSERFTDLLSPAAIERTGLFEPRMIQRFLRKWEKGVPEQVGYRDNMLICFLLSTQIAADHAQNPVPVSLDPALRTVHHIAVGNDTT